MRLATSGELDQLNSPGALGGLANGEKIAKNSHASESKVRPNILEGRIRVMPSGNGLFRELHLEEPKSAYEGDYVQPRWEDVKTSTITERGSMPSSSNDLNLILLSKEQKNGLVIKKFREFQRADAEGDNKSISNRSMNSESSKINSMSFRPLRFNGVAAEPSEVSILKEVPRHPDDIKSERQYTAGLTSALNDSKALTEQFAVRQLELATGATDFADHQSEQLDIQTINYELMEVKPSPRGPKTPFTMTKQDIDQIDRVPQREITNPSEASQLLRGEIAEVILEVIRNGRFEGELVDGKMNGYGRLFDEQGKLIYEGDFVEDQFHGVGILYNHKTGSLGDIDEIATLEKTAIDLNFVRRAWDRYEGLFFGGQFHGRGYLHFGPRFKLFARFKNGEIESGCCLQDRTTNSVEKLDIYGPELLRRIN